MRTLHQLISSVELKNKKFNEHFLVLYYLFMYLYINASTLENSLGRTFFLISGQFLNRINCSAFKSK